MSIRVHSWFNPFVSIRGSSPLSIAIRVHSCPFVSIRVHSWFLGFPCLSWFLPPAHSHSWLLNLPDENSEGQGCGGSGRRIDFHAGLKNANKVAYYAVLRYHIGNFLLINNESIGQVLNSWRIPNRIVCLLLRSTCVLTPGSVPTTAPARSRSATPRSR